MPTIVCKERIKLKLIRFDVGYTYRAVRSVVIDRIEEGNIEGALSWLYSYYRRKGRSKRAAVGQAVRIFNELVKEMSCEDYQISSEYEIQN